MKKFTRKFLPPFSRPVLRDVKKSVEQNVILDCDIKILLEVLTQAQQVGLVADKYNFIVCNLVRQSLLNS